jgi:hypothetical protein
MRKVEEGLYSYSRRDPFCRPSRSVWGELVQEGYKIVKMTALAPTTLFVGSVFEAYNLEVAQALMSNAAKGSWLGRLLSQNGNDTAECADLLVPVPQGYEATRKIEVKGRSTHWDVSTMGEGSDKGQWFYCPVDGTDLGCHSNVGSYARLENKPTATTQGEYCIYHTTFMNWYHEDWWFRSPRKWFRSNPREVRMTLYFRPPSTWRPDLAKLNANVAASLKVTANGKQLCFDDGMGAPQKRKKQGDADDCKRSRKSGLLASMERFLQ